MKKLITGILLSLLMVSQGWAFGLWDTASLLGGGIQPLPGLSFQTVFLSFDSTLGTATFVRNGGAVNPDTGLWANENLLLQSSTYSNAAWTKANITVGADTTDTLDPSGANLADKLLETTTNGLHSNIQLLAVVSGTYTASLYVKAAGRTKFQLGVGSNVVGSADFDISGLSYSNVTAGYTASITDAGNGWYRCSISGAAASTASEAALSVYLNNGAGFTYAGDITKGVYIYGAQLQRGSTAGPYLATTTAAKYDQPRYVTGKDGVAAHAMLVEESSTNVLLQSNNFDTTWTQLGTPTPVQNKTNPYGNANNAWTLTDNAATAENIYQSPSLLNATEFTLSVWFEKTVGATVFPALSVDRAAVIAGATIDTNNANATLWTAYTGFTILTSSVAVTEVRGNWFRVALTFLTTAAATHNCTIWPAARASATSATGTNAATLQGSVGVYGAQLGALPYATSNVPTTTASATRVAEYGTQATSGLITQDAAATIQGWWKTEGISAGKTQTIWSTYTGAADSTRIAYSGTQLIFTKAKTGQATETIAYDVTITPGTWYHAAVTIAADGTALMYHNGALVGTNGTTTAFKPVIAANMQYGAFNATLQINGVLDSFRFFNRVLTANEILTYVNKGE